MPKFTISILGTEILSVRLGGSGASDAGDITTYPVGFQAPADNLPTSVDKGY